MVVNVTLDDRCRLEAIVGDRIRRNMFGVLKSSIGSFRAFRRVSHEMIDRASVRGGHEPPARIAFVPCSPIKSSAEWKATSEPCRVSNVR